MSDQADTLRKLMQQMKETQDHRQSHDVDGEISEEKDHMMSDETENSVKLESGQDQFEVTA